MSSVHMLYTMLLSFSSCTSACWKREVHAEACLLLRVATNTAELREGLNVMPCLVSDASS